MHDSDKPDSDIQAMGNNVEQYTMGVVISSKVFSMNIDGIYQDKYGSTVRELSTNALDIHKKCGIIDKPFDIHIPSEIMGKFILRDYGCGLSKEDVIEYFGKLFSSSKDQENESVGFFGIGCKSPFTVTDDFLVISIHNHIKTEYAFSRENKGTPRCIVLSSKPTDEPSGISIVIDSGESDEWLNAIRNQLLMFPTKPNVYMDNELIDVGYYELKSYGGVHYGKGLPKQIYINQGGVIYPIDPEQFKDVKFKKAVLSNSFVIYTCDIGLITVPPDRERIEISKSNTENLIKIVDDANVNIDSDVCDYFFENYDGTYQSLKSICSGNSHLVDIRSIIKEKLDNSIYNDAAKSVICNNGFYSSLQKRFFQWDSHNNYFKANPSLYSSFNGKYNRQKKSDHSLVTMFDQSNAPIIVLPYNSTISTAHHLYRSKYSVVYIFRCKKDKVDEVAKVLESYRDYFGSENEIIVVNTTTVNKVKKQIKSNVAANPIVKEVHKFYKMDDQIVSYYNFGFINIDENDSPKSTDEFYLMEVSNDLSDVIGVDYSNYIKDLKNIVLSNSLDKPVYFMKRNHFRHFKYGTKITFENLIAANTNQENYYDLIFTKKKYEWSSKFMNYHNPIICERLQKKPNKEIELICKSLNIDLSVRKHPLKDVMEKIDAFSKVKSDSMYLLKDINISSKDVRGVVKQYFIKES